MKAKCLAGSATLLALCLSPAALAQVVQEDQVPGVVHLRGGDTLQAKDIKIEGLLDSRGVELEVDNKEYYVKVTRIDSMQFLRVKETPNEYVAADSKIRVRLKNGETIMATNAQLHTRAEITYTGDLAGEPRTRAFFLDGSDEPALSDPDDIVRIDFQYQGKNKTQDGPSS